MEIIREIIITGSIILAILIVSLWGLKQWNMYKMMKDQAIRSTHIFDNKVRPSFLDWSGKMHEIF